MGSKQDKYIAQKLFWVGHGEVSAAAHVLYGSRARYATLQLRKSGEEPECQRTGHHHRSAFAALQ